MTNFEKTNSFTAIQQHNSNDLIVFIALQFLWL